MQATAQPPCRLVRLMGYLEMDPQNLTLRCECVRLACDGGQWVTARDLVDVGLLAHPDSGELLALHGLTLLQSNCFADAAAVLALAISHGVDAAEVRYNLAFANFMLKRFEAASKLLSDPAVTLAVPSGHLLSARCAHRLGRAADAMADCRRSLDAQCQVAAAHGLLALLLQEQGREQEAADHVTSALALDASQMEAMLTRATLQADVQQYDAARQSFDALLAIHPQCGRAWLGLALIELGHMELSQAKTHIELAATHMPDHIGTWHVLAWVQILLGDISAAELAFDLSLAVDRNFSETHGGLAVIAAMQGREEDARAGIRRALRLDAESMAARYAELLLLQQHGRDEEGRALLEAFLARPVSNSDMQFRDLVRARMGQLHKGDLRA